MASAGSGLESRWNLALAQDRLNKESFDALLTIIAEVEAEQRDERLNAILTHQLC